MGRRIPVPNRPLTRVRAQFPVVSYALIAMILALVYLRLAPYSQADQMGLVPPAVHHIDVPALRLLTLHIAENGQVLVNGRMVARKDLEAVLRKHASVEKPPPVIVRAAKDLEYRRVLEVLNMVRKAGLKDIRVEVKTP